MVDVVMKAPLITSAVGVKGRRSDHDCRLSADQPGVVSTETKLTLDREQPPPIDIS